MEYPRNRKQIMRFCEGIGLTCSQYEAVEKFIQNHYRRRSRKIVKPGGYLIPSGARHLIRPLEEELKRYARREK